MSSRIAFKYVALSAVMMGLAFAKSCSPAHGAANAPVNLALMCKTVVAGTVDCPISSTRYVTPVAGSRIRAESGWVLWAEVADTAQVYVCLAPQNEGSLSCPSAPALVSKCVVSGARCNEPPKAVGAFRLRWTIPAQNTNGTALTDLAGFWIYSAAEGTPLGKMLQIPSPTVTTIDLTGYGPGKYQFAMTAYNSEGTEGSMTPALSVEQPKPAPNVPGAVTQFSAERIEGK